MISSKKLCFEITYNYIINNKHNLNDIFALNNNDTNFIIIPFLHEVPQQGTVSNRNSKTLQHEDFIKNELNLKIMNHQLYSYIFK